MRTAKLKDFVEINPAVRLAKGIEYPFVPMDAIIPGRRYVIAPSYRVSGGGAKFCGGDTLFARITPCLENGKIAQFKASKTQAAFGSTEYWVFRAREGVSDPAYVFYLATSEIIRGPAEKSMTGASGRQRADISAIEDLEVPAPDLPTQRRIASILSTYDDLIENNTRRIAILEEMARRIYEEWFVRFRFPGHEQVKMVESELGLIPEGWKAVAFTELAEVMSGGTPKKANPEYWNGTIPFYTPKDFPKSPFVLSTEAGVTELGARKCNSNIYPPETVFITARGTVGNVTMAARPMIMNQSCYALNGRNGVGQLFLYQATKATAEAFRQKAHGAVFDTIIVDTFRLHNVIRPDAMVLARYEEVARPIFNLLLVLIQKNANLCATRDLLLPKLIFGELDVSDLPEPEALAA